MHNQSESRVKERGKNMDIFIKEYNAKVKTLEFVKKAYGKCSFGSVDSSYQYLRKRTISSTLTNICRSHG